MPRFTHFSSKSRRKAMAFKRAHNRYHNGRLRIRKSKRKGNYKVYETL